MNRRDWAKGKECQIRIPFVCNRDSSTTVLCHHNLPGISGMGMKAPDECASIGCSDCHDLVDGRTSTTLYTDESIDLWFCHGILRTNYLWVKEHA